MKDFYQMTADEIRNYRGPVHWARCSVLSHNAKRCTDHDLECPSKELLDQAIRNLCKLGKVIIHRRGVTERANGNPDYDGYEGIDYPSQSL